MTEDGAQRSKSLFHGITSALAVFMPACVTEVTSGGLRQRRDWSFIVLAGALSLLLLSTGIYQLKSLYAEHVFGWGAEQLSYYIEMLGGTRAVVLLLIMPLIIFYFYFKPNVLGKPASSTKKPAPTRESLATEITFDLVLARVAVALDILSFICLLPLPDYDTHDSLFGGFAIPVMQSLALCTMQARALLIEAARVSAAAAGEDENVRRVFGALAVLQAAEQMILGPLLFRLVQSATAAVYPLTRLEQMRKERTKLQAKRMKQPNRYRCANRGCGIVSDKGKMLQQCSGKCDVDKKPAYCSQDYQ
ncbi:hypothetical protein HDZ31DRAFT_65566 [Schizophyllum fasciatum]